MHKNLVSVSTRIQNQTKNLKKGQQENKLNCVQKENSLENKTNPMNAN